MLFVLLFLIIGLFVIAFVVLAAIVAIAFFFLDRRVDSRSPRWGVAKW